MYLTLIIFLLVHFNRGEETVRRRTIFYYGSIWIFSHFGKWSNVKRCSLMKERKIKFEIQQDLPSQYDILSLIEVLFYWIGEMGIIGIHFALKFSLSPPPSVRATCSSVLLKGEKVGTSCRRHYCLLCKIRRRKGKSSRSSVCISIVKEASVHFC